MIGTVKYRHSAKILEYPDESSSALDMRSCTATCPNIKTSSPRSDSLDCMVAKAGRKAAQPSRAPARPRLARTPMSSGTPRRANRLLILNLK